MLEVVLATGLMGILLAAALVVPTVVARSGAELDAKFGLVKLQKDLREVLMHQGSCLDALRTHDFSTSGPTDLRIEFQGVNLSAAPEDQLLKAYGVQIDRFQFVNPRLVNAVSPTDSIYSARVQLAAEGSKGSPPARFRATTVGTVYLLIRAGQIVDCLTAANETDTSTVVCTNLGGAMANGICRIAPQPTEVMCADGEYLKGFDERGNKVCAPVPAAGP